MSMISKSKDTNKITESKKYSQAFIVDYVRDMIDEVVKTTLNDRGITAEEYEKRENKRKRLQFALKECIFGSLNDKQFVKDFIMELLTKAYGVDNTNIDYIIPFNKHDYLTINDKFDLILYKYKKEFSIDGLHMLIQKYSLDKLKTINDLTYYCINEDEIEDIFKKEDLNFNFDDKIEIVVQRIYSIYKGYNCIDDIMDMRVDGISGGVNGLPENYVLDLSKEFDVYLKNMNIKKVPRSYDSIWLFYAGKSIHLSFLSFGSYDELRRVCQNIYKFGNPGQLSKMNGYKVNKLKDGSRVVVLRPDFCESWAFFIRKFDVPDLSLNSLIKDNNSEMLIELLSFLVKGSSNISITGAQGTGKTTLLNALLEHIYNMYTLRILEMAFELHVRKRFPDRNVITIQETDNISGQEGLDILKKTDGVVTIVGEVASDPVAAYMLQTAQVASKFTIFSHHAKTFRDLVLSLRNSLLKTGVFNDEDTALEQIVRILNFDIHIEKNIYGKRYIERVTECIPIDEEELPEIYDKATTMEEKMDAFMKITIEYYKKRMGKKHYTYRNIIEFDIDKEEYVFKNPISNNMILKMSKEMTGNDRKNFENFREKYFK